MPRCPHGEVFPGSEPPGAAGSLPGSPGVCADPAEHLAGLNSPMQNMLLGASCLSKGGGLRRPSPQLPMSESGACLGPSWEAADPSGTFPWGYFTLYCPVSGRSMDDTVTQQLQKLP